ncbi:NB-ARC domain-containing protein [Cnuibacter physcomitrellae]|uniref:NB-ARC domain-containing protein n=1 Tax=Cnuibacter physcomitrellae TaxID=1619308 RepID=UPI00157E1169|nr:NB-ARC domain-containing protein [Cnuibacter physcomitrellae]
MSNDPSSVLGLTIKLPTDPIDEPFHNLPVPDFDETGFLGRAAVLRKIKRYILGSWPAISILGDGGIGKTAIALKAAYDLLDDPKSDFEAIVWVTAKNQALTVNEIERISTSIQNSLGMFSEAARELGATSNTDPIDELLSYMTEFRVLLVLDNLETATDARLREFLREIPRGSKVLMTSRIGVHKENDVKLDPLTFDESRALLLNLAQGRNVKLLQDLDEAGRNSLIEKLKGHPLYIKWVVSGVQAGRRPTDMIASNQLLLDFCMSNVYDGLGKGARRVLQSMQVLRGVRYQGELAFVNDLNATDIQKYLLDLMRSNFVSMTHASGYDSDAGYEVGDFAHQYLAGKQPVQDDFRSRVLSKNERLMELSLRMQRTSAQAIRRYDPLSVDIRDHHDAPAARLLVRAIRETKASHLDRAVQTCAEAHALSPGYYETRRVEGYIQTLRRDYAAARTAYELAVELASGPAKAIALYHLGSFLDVEGVEPWAALAAFSDAARLDPDSCAIFLRIAACQFVLGNYLLTLGSIAALIKKSPTSEQLELAFLLCLRSIVFGSEVALTKGDIAAGLEIIETGLALIQDFSQDRFGSISDDWLIHISDVCTRFSAASVGSSYLQKQTEGLAVIAQSKISRAAESGRVTGLIETLPVDQSYGFIRFRSESLFFHVNDLIDRRDWRQLQLGNLLAFEVEFDPSKGRSRARKVRALL